MKKLIITTVAAAALLASVAGMADTTRVTFVVHNLFSKSTSPDVTFNNWSFTVKEPQSPMRTEDAPHDGSQKTFNLDYNTQRHNQPMIGTTRATITVNGLQIVLDQGQLGGYQSEWALYVGTKDEIGPYLKSTSREKCKQNYCILAQN